MLDSDKACNFCETNPKLYEGCPAICPGEYPYLCTRERKHEGEHIACSRDEHEVKKWED